MFGETTRDILLVICTVLTGWLFWLRIKGWVMKTLEDMSGKGERSDVITAGSIADRQIRPSLPLSTPSPPGLDWLTRSQELTAASPASSHYGSSVGGVLQRARKLICPRCGNSNPESQQYCLYCGRSLSSGTQQRISEAQQSSQCPKCHAIIRPGYTFCHSCGYRVAQR